MTRSVVRPPRQRPGKGQAAARAPRGWHPEDIVDGYLLPGEVVRLEETRSVRGFLTGQLVWVVPALVLSILLWATFGAGVTPLVLVGLVALGSVIAVRAVQAWFTRYVVTDLRVLCVHGIVNRHAEFIPWGKVTDISRTETIVQWLARSATIRIESANEKSAFRVVDDVDDPDRFYRELVRMVDLTQGRVDESGPTRRRYQDPD